MNYIGPPDEFKLYVNGTEAIFRFCFPTIESATSGDGVIALGRKYLDRKTDYLISTEMDELFFFNQIITDEQIMAIATHGI